MPVYPGAPDRLFAAFRPIRALLIRTFRGFSSLSIGYHDPESESDTFGPILYTSAGVDRIFRGLQFGGQTIPLEFLAELITRVERPRSDEPRTRPLLRLLEDLRFARSPTSRMPVVIRQGTERLHAPASHPYGGTGAAYVMTRSATPFERPGLLTCKHVVTASLGGEAQIGDPVPMANGDPDRTLIDMAPNPIDAAVLEADQSDLGNPLPVMAYVAQYLPVEIRSASGQLKVNRVTAVTDTYNVWDDPDIPAYLELEKPAASGDSGALVINRATGAAVGLYRGRFDSRFPLQRSGRAAHLRQVKELLGLELYE